MDVAEQAVRSGKGHMAWQEPKLGEGDGAVVHDAGNAMAHPFRRHRAGGTRLGPVLRSGAARLLPAALLQLAQRVALLLYGGARSGGVSLGLASLSLELSLNLARVSCES